MGPDSSSPGQGSLVEGVVALFGSFRYGQYYEHILSGVVAGAEAAGGSVIAIQVSDGVLPSSSEVASQDAVTRAAWDHFGGAIIIQQSLSLEYVARLRAAGKFLVAIGQEPRGTQSSVGIDNVDGVRQAVSHLAGHGHTKIAFLSPGWQVDTPERFSAYRRQLTELGLTPLPLLGVDLSPQVSMDEQGYLAAQQFLAAERTCTAVLVGTDLIALGFVRGLREAGVDIPGEIAVVGIDDVDEAAVSVPPLATVAISFERVGRTAFEVARAGGRGEPVDSHYFVSERFVPRESCGCSSGSAARATAGVRSPIEVFRQALADAAGEEALGTTSPDPGEAVALADQIARLIGAGRIGPQIDELATRINELCTLDRSVQSALRAVRALAHALTDQLRGREPGQALEISFAAADLCDAIRSGQLQRRMSEYVDLKRMQVSHYFIANNLLSHDRNELRSLGWLKQTPAQAGALCLWNPIGQAGQVLLQGLYERRTGPSRPSGSSVPVESFPPPQMLREPTGEGRIVVITQVRLEDSDWGLLAVAGGRVLQSALVQETFQQWSILMSASLDQERANADLARQTEELNAAYETEMALLDEVRVSEERYALAAEAGHDALWDWDIASGKVFYSSNWKALLGYLETEVGTAPHEWLGRVHPDDALMVQEQVTRTLSGAEQFIDFEHRLQVSTGEYRWMACSGRSVADEQGRPVRLVGSITDVTVRRLLQEQLLQEARYDGLTGLAKSTMFKDRLNEAFELSRQKPEYWFALLFLDLDGFKAVNDDLGHAAGDELLASVAKRLQSSLRKNDTAARLGGDEFALILTEVDQVSELPQIVERIQRLIRQPHQVGDQTANVGAAIGVAISSGEYASAQDMLQEADAAMYRAKRRNKQAASGAAPASIRLTVG